jgi:nitroreductase
MNKSKIILGTVLSIFSTYALAQDVQDIRLPPPRMEGGMPLMETLKNRHSTREFGAKKVEPQVLSDLLWAANGINRPGSGMRTAPSARNWQEVDVYVITEEGAYLYDAKNHQLKMVAAGDHRKLAGTQDYVATAPVNLVFVADTSKVKGGSSNDESMYIGADTGFISQNVYLFCVSEGLVTVVRAMVDREALAPVLKLSKSQKITLAQSVGYPKGKE